MTKQSNGKANNSSIGERLTEFLKYKRMEVKDLAIELGYNRSEKLHRLVRDKTAQPNYETIMDVSNYFPDLNIQWWLKGTGSMLQNLADDDGTDDDAVIAAIQRSTTMSDAEKNNLLVKLIRDMKEEKKRLQSELYIFSRFVERMQNKNI